MIRCRNRFQPRFTARRALNGLLSVFSTGSFLGHSECCRSLMVRCRNLIPLFKSATRVALEQFKSLCGTGGEDSLNRIGTPIMSRCRFHRIFLLDRVAGNILAKPDFATHRACHVSTIASLVTGGSLGRCLIQLMGVRHGNNKAFRSNLLGAFLIREQFTACALPIRFHTGFRTSRVHPLMFNTHMTRRKFLNYNFFGLCAALVRAGVNRNTGFGVGRLLLDGSRMFGPLVTLTLNNLCDLLFATLAPVNVRTCVLAVAGRRNQHILVTQRGNLFSALYLTTHFTLQSLFDTCLFAGCIFGSGFHRFPNMRSLNDIADKIVSANGARIQRVTVFVTISLRTVSCNNSHNG